MYIRIQDDPDCRKVIHCICYTMGKQLSIKYDISREERTNIHANGDQ